MEEEGNKGAAYAAGPSWFFSSSSVEYETNYASPATSRRTMRKMCCKPPWRKNTIMKYVSTVKGLSELNSRSSD